MELFAFCADCDHYFRPISGEGAVSEIVPGSGNPETIPGQTSASGKLAARTGDEFLANGGQSESGLKAFEYPGPISVR